MTRPTDVAVEIQGSGSASAEDRILLHQLRGSADSRDGSRGHGPSGSAPDPFVQRTWTNRGLLGPWHGARPPGGEA